MKIEEIKKEILLTSIKNGVGYAYKVGGFETIDTYYTPLAESHRELVEELEYLINEYRLKINVGNESLIKSASSALSNAKKLINEKQ